MQQPQQQKWRAALFGLSVPSLCVNVVEVLLEVGAEDLPGDFYFHCEPNLGTQAVRAFFNWLYILVEILQPSSTVSSYLVTNSIVL